MASFPGAIRCTCSSASVPPGMLHAQEREITVTPGDATIGTITLAESDLEAAHKNKYGHDYDRPAPDNPAYARP